MQFFNGVKTLNLSALFKIKLFTWLIIECYFYERNVKFNNNFMCIINKLIKF